MFETKIARDIEFEIYTETENNLQRKYYNFTKYIKNVLNNMPQNIFNSKRIITQMMEDIINKNIEPKSNIVKCRNLLNKVKTFKGKYTTGIEDCVNTGSFKVFKSGNSKHQGTYGPIYLIDFFIQQFDSDYRVAIHEVMEAIQLEADGFAESFKDTIVNTTQRIKSVANNEKMQDTAKEIDQMIGMVDKVNNYLSSVVESRKRQLGLIENNETEDAYFETVKYNNEQLIENEDKRSQIEIDYNLTKVQLEKILKIKMKPIGTTSYMPVQEYNNKLIIRRGKQIIELTRSDIFMDNNNYDIGVFRSNNIRVTKIKNKKELPYI